MFWGDALVTGLFVAYEFLRNPCRNYSIMQLMVTNGPNPLIA